MYIYCNYDGKRSLRRRLEGEILQADFCVGIS